MVYHDEGTLAGYTHIAKVRPYVAGYFSSLLFNNCKYYVGLQLTEYSVGLRFHYHSDLDDINETALNDVLIAKPSLGLVYSLSRNMSIQLGVGVLISDVFQITTSGDYSTNNSDIQYYSFSWQNPDWTTRTDLTGDIALLFKLYSTDGLSDDRHHNHELLLKIFSSIDTQPVVGTNGTAILTVNGQTTSYEAHSIPKLIHFGVGINYRICK